MYYANDVLKYLERLFFFAIVSIALEFVKKIENSSSFLACQKSAVLRLKDKLCELDIRLFLRGHEKKTSLISACRGEGRLTVRP